MSSTQLVVKYNELDGLYKKYCNRKEKEIKALHKQLEEEISTNVELRKIIALLESKLASEKECVVRLERLYTEATTSIDISSKKKEAQLKKLEAETLARAALVEQRERDCAERMSALELREEQFWSGFNNLEENRTELEAGLFLYKKTMLAELQHSHEAVDVAKDCLCDLRIKGNDLTGKEEEIEQEMLMSQYCTFLVSEERACRERVVNDELEFRRNMFGDFFHDAHTIFKATHAKNAKKMSQLYAAEDLLQLHNVQFASRVQKEKELLQEEQAKSEMLRKEFAAECRGVLRDVSELLDSIPAQEVGKLRDRLERKLQALC